VHPTPAASRLLAALKAAALCLALGAAAGAADTITLKNGGTLKCKVIRETKELVKVRMPRRGKIVTTFLNRGAVESIATTSDIENRRLFQSSGVRNPAKNFEPVYYSGIRTAAAGGKPGLPGGKPTMKTTARDRGATEGLRGAREGAERQGTVGRLCGRGAVGRSDRAGHDRRRRDEHEHGDLVGIVRPRGVSARPRGTCRRGGRGASPSRRGSRRAA